MAWDMDWQYVAGFFDGEGSIQGPPYRYRCSMYQNAPEVLYRIQTFVGRYEIEMKMCEVKRPKTKRHPNIGYMLYTSRTLHVYQFLVYVSDFLIVKRAQADQILSLIEDQTVSMLEGAYKPRANKKDLLAVSEWEWKP